MNKKVIASNPSKIKLGSVQAPLRNNTNFVKLNATNSNNLRLFDKGTEVLNFNEMIEKIDNQNGSVSSNASPVKPNATMSGNANSVKPNAINSGDLRFVDTGTGEVSFNEILDKLASRDEEIKQDLGNMTANEVPNSNTEEDSGKILRGLKVGGPILYSYDENGNVSLNQVHPELQEKMDLLVELCAAENIPLKITEDVRTVDRQNDLYAQGRTTDGPRRTDAPGSNYSSYHQWGLAFDVCINIKGDAYNRSKLEEVKIIAETLGLECGDKWSLNDLCHYQLSGYGNSQELREKYGDPAGFADTWEFDYEHYCENLSEEEKQMLVERARREQTKGFNK